jgi:ABC-type transport system involved in multi-copper enzyme maturation permease subunit
MSPLVEIRLIALREVRRSLRSTKGIALGVVTLLGAVLASFVSVWAEEADRRARGVATTESYVDLKRQLIGQATGDPSFANYVASIPTSLLVFLKVTVWFSPLLVALLGFDAVSGELQHRGIRFWAVRSRRSSLFIGKLIGLWALVTLLIFGLDLLAGTVAITRGYLTVPELAAWGTRFWLVAAVIAGAWAAVATFISACFATPIVALLTTFAVFFASWLVGVGGFVSRMRHAAGAGDVATHMAAYEYFYPNAYDTLLLSPEAPRALTGLAIIAAFVALCAAAGSLLLQRRDI